MVVMASVVKQAPLGGCCGDTVVNFSLLTLPDSMFIDVTNPALWFTIVVIFIEPYFKPVIGVYEKKTQFLSSIFGSSKAFYIYVIASYLYSIWTFIFLNRTLILQPHVGALQRNDFLAVGYIIVFIGLCMKIYTYLTASIARIMGGYYFKLKVTIEAGYSYLDPYYHPLGTASVVCYFGLSLMQGSMVGIVLTSISALAYYWAYHLERYLFFTIRGSPSTYGSIDHKKVPPPIRSKLN